MRKCLADESAHIPVDDIQIHERLNYVGRPIASSERRTKSLRNKGIDLVKVQWRHKKGIKMDVRTGRGNEKKSFEVIPYQDDFGDEILLSGGEL